MKSQNKKMDIGGIIVALVCVVHCIALPLLTSSFSLFSLSKIDNPYVDAVLWLVSLWLGLRVLIPNFKKHHHNKAPLILFVLGIIMFGTKDFYHSQFKYWWISIALCLLVLAHLINIILSTKAIAIQGCAVKK